MSALSDAEPRWLRPRWSPRPGQRGDDSSGGFVVCPLELRSRGRGRSSAGRGSTMTAQSDLKKLIRERQQKTGESYTAARVHVMRARSERLGVPPDAEGGAPGRVVAAGVKGNELATT